MYHRCLLFFLHIAEYFLSFASEKNQNKKCLNPFINAGFRHFGGERGIRTLATLRAYYSLSRGAPFGQTWVFLHDSEIIFSNIDIHALSGVNTSADDAAWRRERDLNPRYLSVSLVFKTSSISRSDISPHSHYIIPTRQSVVKAFFTFSFTVR